MSGTSRKFVRRLSLIALILPLISGFLWHTAQAQTPGAGSIFVNTDVMISSETEELEGTAAGDYDIDRMTFMFSPSAGYYLTDQVILGVGFGMQFTSEDNHTDNTEMEEDLYTFSPFVRYVEPVFDRMQLFGQFGVSFGSGTGEETTPGGSMIEKDISVLEAGINPGFTYFLNDSFALESSFGFLGYRSEEVTDVQEMPESDPVEVAHKSSETVLDFSMSTVSIGLTYYW